MTDSNYWIEHYVSYSSARNSGVHQVTKDYEIEVSDSVDFNPSIDIYVARNEKLSIQVPKSTKYHKVKRILAADFLQYFNQTLYKLDHLETSGGEYYINTDQHEPIFIEIWRKHKNSEKKAQSNHMIIEIRLKTTEELEELPKHPITESETVTFSHFKVLKKTPTKDDGPRLMRYTLYAGTLKSYVDDETVFCGNYKSKHHAKSIFEVVCSQDEVHTTQQFRNYCNAIAIDHGYNIRSCYLCQLFGPDKREKEYDDDVPFNPDRPVGCRRDIDAQGLIDCKPEEAMTCEQFKLKDRPLNCLKAQYANINRYIWFKNADGSVSEEYQERKDYWGYRDFDEF